jgi:AbrB family looped-hinge helix DNA binding protein
LLDGYNFLKKEENRMTVVQVSQKGQILIPKAIRKRHGVTPGSRVQVLEQSGGILIKPAPEDPIDAACGFLRGEFSLTDDLIREHRKELEDDRENRPR